MSGQLVGELMRARRDGHLHGLKINYLLAAITIADICRTDDRRGRVPWSVIQRGMSDDGMTPASLRTAERAVAELKKRGVVRVVQRGHKTHGSVRAPVYEMAVLPPVKVAVPSGTFAPATQDGGSTFAPASQGGGTKADVLPPLSDVLPPLDPFAPANGNAPISDDAPHNGSYFVTSNGTTSVTEKRKPTLTSFALAKENPELPREPSKPTVALVALRKHYNDNPLTDREIAGFHFGTDKLIKSQISSVVYGMRRAVKARVAVEDYSRGPRAYRPLPTKGWNPHA